MFNAYQGAIDMDASKQPTQVWLTSTEYRQRNGGHKNGIQANSTFWLLIRQGRLAKPRYPFGPTQPRWLLADIEAAEHESMEASHA